MLVVVVWITALLLIMDIVVLVVLWVCSFQRVKHGMFDAVALELSGGGSLVDKLFVLGVLVGGS